MDTVFRNDHTPDVMSIAMDILRQWWAILLFALSVMLLSGMFASCRYVPEYTSSATFTVHARTGHSMTNVNVSDTKRIAEKLRIVLESEIFQQQIAEELGVPEYTAKTEVDVLPETNLMTLKVRERTGLQAYLYIRAILGNYRTISDHVVRGVVLDVIEEPLFPSNPSNASGEGKFRILGFIAGLAVALSYIGYLSYQKDTVKNPKEAANKLAARLLGSVCHEGRPFLLRRKTKTAHSMVITNPLLSFRYTESCCLTAFRVRSRMDRKQAKTLLITSVAENEGKSTLAANMAVALAQEGKNVLLIDADFRKPSLYRIFEIPKEETIDLIEILRKGEGLENIIKKYPHQDLYFILNHAATGSIDDILANGHLRVLVKYAREKFDYVIIDTAPMGLFPDAEGLADYVDASILVVRHDRVLAQNINDAIDTLNTTGGNVLGIVYNDAMMGIPGFLGSYGYGLYGHGRYGGTYAR